MADTESQAKNEEDISSEKRDTSVQSPEASDFKHNLTIDDDHNPEKWPLWRKWSIVMLLSYMALAGNLAVLICAPAVPEILAEFGSDNEQDGTLLVSIWNLGGTIVPFLVGPLSEVYGRLPVYHVANIAFILFSTAAALSRNVSMLIAFRFFCGLSIASTTLNGSIVGDVFAVEQRGRAQSIMTIMPLLGPICGPIIGGFLSQNEGWRWSFWLTTIMVAAGEIGFLLLYRETYEPIIQRRNAIRLSKKTGNADLLSTHKQRRSLSQILGRDMLRPFKIFAIPIFLMLTTCTSLIYGYIYLTLTTITEIFEDVYGFSQSTAGLSFLGVGLGMAVGVFVCGTTLDWHTKRMKERHNGEVKPEWRLPPMVLGSLIVPVGLFMYGWTAQVRVQFMAPIVGTSLLGFGLCVITIPVTTYLVDAFGKYRASALAALTVYRQVVSTVLPLAGPPLFDSLGLGWGNSVLAFITLATVPLPFLIMRYGERLRKSAKIEERLK